MALSEYLTRKRGSEGRIVCIVRSNATGDLNIKTQMYYAQAKAFTTRLVEYMTNKIYDF